MPVQDSPLFHTSILRVVAQTVNSITFPQYGEIQQQRNIPKSSTRLCFKSFGLSS